jgi:hypothetical protein
MSVARMHHAVNAAMHLFVAKDLVREHVCYYTNDAERTRVQTDDFDEFTTGADLVLPLLYARKEYCELQKGATGLWHCVIGGPSDLERFSGTSRSSAALAVCIALLRANGVIVEQGAIA